MTRIAILNYGMGNLRSVEKALERVGAVPAINVSSPRGMVPIGSEANLPAYLKLGNIVVLVTLYAIAMLPLPSMAMLDIQRLCPSGAYVPSWCTTQFPPGFFRSSNQRTPPWS